MAKKETFNGLFLLAQTPRAGKYNHRLIAPKGIPAGLIQQVSEHPEQYGLVVSREVAQTTGRKGTEWLALIGVDEKKLKPEEKSALVIVKPEIVQPKPEITSTADRDAALKKLQTIFDKHFENWRQSYNWEQAKENILRLDELSREVAQTTGRKGIEWLALIGVDEEKLTPDEKSASVIVKPEIVQPKPEITSTADRDAALKKLQTIENILRLDELSREVAQTTGRKGIEWLALIGVDEKKLTPDEKAEVPKAEALIGVDEEKLTPDEKSASVIVKPEIVQPKPEITSTADRDAALKKLQTIENILRLDELSREVAQTTGRKGIEWLALIGVDEKKLTPDEKSASVIVKPEIVQPKPEITSTADRDAALKKLQTIFDKHFENWRQSYNWEQAKENILRLPELNDWVSSFKDLPTKTIDYTPVKEKPAKKSSAWPWIMVILLALAAGGFFVWQSQQDKNLTEQIPEEPLFCEQATDFSLSPAACPDASAAQEAALALYNLLSRESAQALQAQIDQEKAAFDAQQQSRLAALTAIERKATANEAQQQQLVQLEEEKNAAAKEDNSDKFAEKVKAKQALEQQIVAENYKAAVSAFYAELRTWNYPGIVDLAVDNDRNDLRAWLDTPFNRFANDQALLTQALQNGGFTSLDSVEGNEIFILQQLKKLTFEPARNYQLSELQATVKNFFGK